MVPSSILTIRVMGRHILINMLYNSSINNFKIAYSDPKDNVKTRTENKGNLLLVELAWFTYIIVSVINNIRNTKCKSPDIVAVYRSFLKLWSLNSHMRQRNTHEKKILTQEIPARKNLGHVPQNRKPLKRETDRKEEKRLLNK